MTETRVSQLNAEALVNSDPNARVSQIGVEALTDTPNIARVSQISVETLTDTPNMARVSQISVEVLRHAPPPVPPGPGPITQAYMLSNTAPSGFRSTGISISMSAPLIKGGSWIRDFSEEISGYSQEKGADMYCLSADITLQLRNIDLIDWIKNGLGRDIEVKAPSQRPIFNGFVDGMSIGIGKKSYEVGRLMDIGNRSFVIYTPLWVNATTGSNRGSGGTETALANNILSQAEYGIIEKSLDAGECIITDTQNTAEYFRDDFLREHSYPKGTGSYSSESGDTATINLNCVGYWKWLEAYIYNNRATPAALGYSTMDAKIKTILAADPNGIFSTDYADIAANPAINGNQEKNNRTALTIIKGLVAGGDALGNRWLFGIGQKRKAYYKRLPLDIPYEYRVNDEEQKLVINGTNKSIDPWDIEPGLWYITSDIYKPVSWTTPYPIPTASFIETVRFDAPDKFSLTEGKLSRVGQRLALKGLGSI